MACDYTSIMLSWFNALCWTQLLFLFSRALPSSFQVDVLRGKVASLESELRTANVASGQLQDKLSEGRRQWEREARVLREERKNLATQVGNVARVLREEVRVPMHEGWYCTVFN